jgi:protein TonB
VETRSTEPLDRVLALDARTSGWSAWLGFTSAAALLFAAMVILGALASRQRNGGSGLDVPQEIEVLSEPPPPPAPPPPPVTDSDVSPATPIRATAHAPHASSPSPAAAAKVLTQEPAPDGPVDLTDNTIVQGNAATYGGGYTGANGTAAAVRTMPPPSSGPAETRAFATTSPNRSRRASLGGADEWKCPFPSESEAAQVDDAYVTLVVDVRADGTPSAVRVVSDPGHGFGREARQCAMGRRYVVALDHAGNAVAGSTRPFRVHFSR